MTSDFGGGPRTSAGGADIFLVKYSASGAYLWDKEFGGVNDDLGTAVAADSHGNVLLGAFISDALNFGGGPISTGCALVKFSAAGSHVWSRGDVCPYSVAADGSDNVIVASQFNTSLTVGGTPVTTTGLYDVYVAKFSATGSPMWVRTGGGTGNDLPARVAVDSGGNVFLAGQFQGAARFGGFPVTSAGGYDIFLVKYAADGTGLWAQRFGGSDDDGANGIATDANGNVVLAGFYQNTGNFGGPQSLVSSGYKDIVLAKYDGAGNYVWAHSYGTNSFSEAPKDVAVDRASGNVTVTGPFPYQVNFGGGAMTSMGQNDIFLGSVGP
jgi:hypothetical protein